MDEHQIYKQLHKELAEKFKTSPEIINYIRSEMIGFKKTKQDLISHCLRKKLNADSHKPQWEEKLNFLLSCSENTLNMIKGTEPSSVAHPTELNNSVATENSRGN